MNAHNDNLSDNLRDNLSDNLIPLDVDQCRAILAAGSVGRVGWSSPSGHVVAPVNYIYLDPVIDLTPAPHSALADLVRPTRVAFQVDNLDCSGEDTVIVLIRGQSHRATQSMIPDESLVQPDGTGRFAIEIEIDSMTGHRVTRKALFRTSTDR
jgi:hypothetical protein